MKTILLSSLLILSQMASASPDHPAPTIPKDFEHLKQLLGSWEGKSQMKGKEVPIRVTYELTSAGTAITETLMQGTPEEMVSVYHKDGDSVAMTHYCALGNQPHMKLTSASNTRMTFEMAEPQGLQSANEPHMHAVTLTLKNPDLLEQQWSHYVEGKKVDEVTFSLHRQ